MIKWFKKMMRQEQGFSLVEALVTITIMGIAMVPISMVFTQTITTTIDSRSQLVANGLAQEYVERIKGSDFNTFNEFFDTEVVRDTSVVADQSFFTTMGFRTLPDGYKAVVRYDTAVDHPDFTFSAVEQTINVDAVIRIDSGDVEDVEVVDPDDASANEDYPNPAETVDLTRIIKVTARRSTGKVKVDYLDSVAIKGTGFEIDYDPVAPAVRFELGNGGDASPDYTTKIIVDSDIASEFKVYVYESIDNKINATTEVVNGYVGISRNMAFVNGTPKRIVEIEVAIVRLRDNVEIAKLVTTKIDE